MRDIPGILGRILERKRSELQTQRHQLPLQTQREWAQFSAMPSERREAGS